MLSPPLSQMPNIADPNVLLTLTFCVSQELKLELESHKNRVTQLKDVLTHSLKEKATVEEQARDFQRLSQCTTGTTTMIQHMTASLQHRLHYSERRMTELEEENEDLKLKLSAYTKLNGSGKRAKEKEGATISRAMAKELQQRSVERMSTPRMRSRNTALRDMCSPRPNSRGRTQVPLGTATPRGVGLTTSALSPLPPEPRGDSTPQFIPGSHTRTMSRCSRVSTLPSQCREDLHHGGM